MQSVYQRLVDGNRRFGNSLEDTCAHEFACPPERISEDVLLAPWWMPELFAPFATAIEPLSPAKLGLWTLTFGSSAVTFIRSGIGAPAIVDVVFSLRGTPCKKIVFLGSVGGLASEISIGDIVIPAASICGDGACRYITEGALRDGDCFGQVYHPDRSLFESLSAAASAIAGTAGVRWHIGKAFSVDTVFAQFAHIDEIMALGADCIEMETAVLFKAAAACGLKAAALFSVSDNTLQNKSLYAGRTDAEMAYRAETRATVLTRIALATLGINA